MSDKILSKYNIGLSVIVRSKDIDVWDLVIILLQIDSRSVEKFVCVNSEYLSLCCICLKFCYLYYYFYVQ